MWIHLRRPRRHPMAIVAKLQRSELTSAKLPSRLAAGRWAVYDLSDETVTSEASSHAASLKGLICPTDQDLDLQQRSRRDHPSRASRILWPSPVAKVAWVRRPSP